MDVVSQALHVAAGASVPVPGGVVSVDFDLGIPTHRAAYAAAMAVFGALDESRGRHAGPLPPIAAEGPAPAPVATAEPEPEANPLDEAMRRAFHAAVDDLVGDPARTPRVVADTFPLVREALRAGANVEGVARVQFVRWTDAQRAARPAG